VAGARFILEQPLRRSRIRAQARPGLHDGHPGGVIRLKLRVRADRGIHGLVENRRDRSADGQLDLFLAPRRKFGQHVSKRFIQRSHCIDATVSKGLGAGQGREFDDVLLKESDDDQRWSA